MKGEAGTQVSQLSGLCAGKHGPAVGAGSFMKNRTKNSASLLSMAGREPNWRL
jgi:hypothetical protein